MFIALSFLVLIFGLCMYCFAPPPSKAIQIGYAMFCCGLLAFLLQFGGWWGTFSPHYFR
jgi:hypothetical protein